MGLSLVTAVGSDQLKAEAPDYWPWYIAIVSYIFFVKNKTKQKNLGFGNTISLLGSRGNIFVINYILVYNMFHSYICYHVWSSGFYFFFVLPKPWPEKHLNRLLQSHRLSHERITITTRLWQTFLPQRGDIFTAMLYLLLHYLFMYFSGKCWYWWSLCMTCDLACQIQVSQLLCCLSYRWCQLGGKSQQVGNNLSHLYRNQVSLKERNKVGLENSNVEHRLFLWGR